MKINVKNIYTIKNSIKSLVRIDIVMIGGTVYNVICSSESQRRELFNQYSREMGR